MTGLAKRRRGWPRRAAGACRVVAALLVGALAPGCDYPFEPYQENETAIFSLFGYLDLKADTQWVRVMPVRQNLFLEPKPIDAVVTLEHLGTGRVVTLNDSLFRFQDPRLDGVAYAYNFWTTERLEPGASYRLEAVRAGGASTTATVVMPHDLDLSLFNDRRFTGVDFAFLRVRAERVLFVEVLYAVRTSAGDPSGLIAIRQPPAVVTGEPGLLGISIRGDTLQRDGYVDVRRQEIRVAVARADWPYHPGLSDLTVTLPSTMPSNVENGLGFVGGVATWTIPFARCEVLRARPDRDQTCVIPIHAQTASLAGRVVREPCGAPAVLADIHLTERFADGGAIIRTWRTGWDGSYRFEGIEPGADLTLNLTPAAPALHLPRLAPGERRLVSDIAVPFGC